MQVMAKSLGATLQLYINRCRDIVKDLVENSKTYEPCTTPEVYTRGGRCGRCLIHSCMGLQQEGLRGRDCLELKGRTALT